MEQERIRTSNDAGFELDAIMSVFHYSRALFPDTRQRQTALAERSQQEVFFSYNQDLSHAFEDNSASGVPPVNELFAGFIGSYKYSVRPSRIKYCSIRFYTAAGDTPSLAIGGLSHDNPLTFQDKNNQVWAGQTTKGPRREEDVRVHYRNEVDTAPK